MPVEIVHRYTREMLQSRPDALFLFGDNMAGLGRGGQAAACRDEPNAVGVPTKWYPSMKPHSFLRDMDRDNFRLIERIDGAFERAAKHLSAGGTVILPADGIGTGLADLPPKAPRVFDYITGKISAMKETDNAGN